MSFLTQHHLMSNPDFVGRVNVAALTAASLIIQEEGFSREHPTSARHNLAAQHSAGFQPGLPSFIRLCALNVSIAAAEEAAPNSSPDGDLQYVVNSNWDSVAAALAPVA